MIYANTYFMHEEPMRHYLLTPYEAEVLAVFRGLSPRGKDMIAGVMAQQMGHRHIPIQPVELSLVKKGA